MTCQSAHELTSPYTPLFIETRRTIYLLSIGKINKFQIHLLTLRNNRLVPPMSGVIYPGASIVVPKDVDYEYFRFAE